MFEKILEYQKLDGQVLQLRRSLEKDETKIALNKAVAIIKDSQAKILELENKAKALIEEYNTSKKNYETTYNQIVKYSKLDVNSLNEEDATKYFDDASSVVNSLSFLERTLSMQAENINSIIKNFEIYRNNIVTYKQKYKDLKEKVDANQVKIEPEVKAIQAKMAELEKQINADMLNKYKHLRQDRIFPVFVPLNNNACGGCSMQLPSALMNKLKENGYLECEQCRRYIYLEN